MKYRLSKGVLSENLSVEKKGKKKKKERTETCKIMKNPGSVSIEKHSFEITHSFFPLLFFVHPHASSREKTMYEKSSPSRNREGDIPHCGMDHMPNKSSVAIERLGNREQIRVARQNKETVARKLP